MERVYLRADLRLFERDQNLAGRCGHRVGGGRRLSLGLAHGRLAVWLAAGRIHLLVLCRVLRVRYDRFSERVKRIAFLSTIWARSDSSSAARPQRAFFAAFFNIHFESRTG